jgi:hypothetical protein
MSPSALRLIYNSKTLSNIQFCLLIPLDDDSLEDSFFSSFAVTGVFDVFGTVIVETGVVVFISESVVSIH